MSVRTRTTVLPGFGLTMGITLTWLSLLVLIPLAGLFLKSATIGGDQFWATATNDRVLASLKLSFAASFAAAAVNAVFGFVVAWVLVRYEFPGRRIADAIVDIPFALPTAVAGIALTALYAGNGWIGRLLPFKVSFTPLGVFVALTFIGLPFVVRTVQPIIAELEHELEEASATLGATRFQTVVRVLLPPLIPALLTGFALAFARAIGEYGSVIFISGNLAYISEIAPLLIVVKLEQYDYAGATGIATIMLAISFIALLVINLIQAWSRRRFGYV